MTVVRARKILGKEANNMTDDQVVFLIKAVKSLADVCAEKIDDLISREDYKVLLEVK